MSSEDNEIQQLLRQLAEVDHEAAVWCACQCARTVLHLLSEGEGRPGAAIETAEAWLAGGATTGDCRQASASAYAAYRAAYDARDHSAAFAANAANAAVSVVFDEHPAKQAVYAAGNAAYADRRSDQAANARLLGLVSAIRWPLAVPAPSRLRASPPRVQVAWDALSEPTADPTIPALVEAHARAGRLGLDWSDPVQRAIAERTTDEARIRQLLAGGRQGEPP